MVSCSLEAAVNKSIEEDVKLRLVCQRRTRSRTNILKDRATYIYESPLVICPCNKGPAKPPQQTRDGTIRRTFTLVLLIATRDNTTRYMLLYVTVVTLNVA